MFRRRALVSSLSLAFLLLASPAWAGFDEGVAPHNRGRVGVESEMRPNDSSREAR